MLFEAFMLLAQDIVHTVNSGSRVTVPGAQSLDDSVVVASQKCKSILVNVLAEVSSLTSGLTGIVRCSASLLTLTESFRRHL